MSFSDDWTTSKRLLAEQTNMGRAAVRTAVDLLVELGYVEVEQSDPKDPSTIEYVFSWGEYTPVKKSDHPPVRKSDHPRSRNPTTTKEHSEERKSLSIYPEGAHAREDEPTDTQPTYSQEPVGWLMHFAAQQGYELAINQAQSVVMRLAQRGLSDEDDRDYLVDKLGQAIAQDRPPGKFAHYVGNKSDVEQWLGSDDDPDGGPAGGMALFDEVANEEAQ
jgi:hypothetical protein